MAISRFGFRKIGGEPGGGPGIFEVAILIKIQQSVTIWLTVCLLVSSALLVYQIKVQLNQAQTDIDILLKTF